MVPDWRAGGVSSELTERGFERDSRVTSGAKGGGGGVYLVAKTIEQALQS